MPQIPIPDDWDGTSWRCVQVQWPDSDAYIGILHGLLSYLMRGRLYDASTGSILAAKAVGEQIWDRNTPLLDCSGLAVPGAGSAPTAPGGGGLCWGDCEDDLMPCIDINSLLKIEGGVLYARDSCCEWQAVGNLATQSTPVDDPFYDPENPATYYACGRAKGVLDIAYTVAQACWDAKGDFPTTWINQVKAAAPGYNLGNQQIVDCIMQAGIVDVLFDEADVFDADMRQQVLCTIAGLFSADAAALSLDDFKAVKSGVRSVWNAASVTASQIGGFFVFALDALGHTDVSNASVLGATDSTADCACPGVELPADPTPEWDDLAWAHYFDFQTGMHGWSHDVPPQDQDERGIITDPEDGNGFAGLTAVFTAVSGTEITVKRVEIRWSADAAFNYAGEHRVRVGSQELLLMAVDTDPSGGGTFRQTQNTNYSFTNEQIFAWVDSGYAAEGNRDLGDGFRFLSLAIGGNGRDPFV